MTLKEIELQMCAAAQAGKTVVVVDHDGRTFRGTAAVFSDWYREDSGYAALVLTDGAGCRQRFGSDQILYIETSGSGAGGMR